MNCVIFDVDGVFTTGQFLYTKDGKIGKMFGAHDADGIKLLKNKIKIQAISADKRGFEITKRRIQDDMGIKLTLISEKERLDWLKENFDLKTTIYVGDGIHDAKIFDEVGYSIAPKNAFKLTRDKADYVTEHNSGEGAVLDACLHIIEKFLGGLNFE
ncbi:HAD hydrolase family protein [Candidatus Woesearchaeota archaeon]|nr:HAD hydrolase family protein [Candidatus Woesearchaeota archaeon]